MKHNLTKLLMTTILFSIATGGYAQSGATGINTAQPKSNLDVNGRKDGSGNLLTTDVTGLQAPRLTRAELTSKGNALYGADQKGALVYITDISGGDVASQRVNITAIGYYCFDGSVWLRVSTGPVTANNGLTANANTVKLGGALTEATVIAQSANTLSFTGTAISPVKITNTTGTATTPVSALQIADGSQAVGKVLTSDANGNTSWDYIVMEKINGIIVAGSAGANSTLNSSGASKNLGSNVTLSPGLWEVEINVLLDVGTTVADSYTWAKFSLADSAVDIVKSLDLVGNTTLVSAGVTTVNVAGGDTNSFYGIANGKLRINNTSAGDKTYYLLFAGSNYKGTPRTINLMGTTAYGENYIVALRIK